jgi:hypothetical protein
MEKAVSSGNKLGGTAKGGRSPGLRKQVEGKPPAERVRLSCDPRSPMTLVVRVPHQLAAAVRQKPVL